MTLQAIVHAAPVIAQSMPPEAVKTLPPIEVSNWPKPDKLAWWTFWAAVAAAGVALVTFIAVCVQIGIAVRELAFVKSDLRNNEKSLKELMRRPMLSMVPGYTPTYPKDYTADYHDVQFSLLVENSGNKSAHEVMVELLIPLEVIFDQTVDGAHAIKPENGRAFVLAQVRAPDKTVFWPNGFSVSLVQSFRFIQDVGDVSIRYRIFDEYDSHPADGTYNSFTFYRAAYDVIATALRAGNA